MTPVINPWVFYFMDIADGVDVTCTILGIIFAICAIVAIIMYCIIRADCHVDDDEIKSAKSAIKLFGWVAGILLIIAALVPSQTTITKMIIAQNVTYERVETVTDTVETVYNDIMELFESDD